MAQKSTSDIREGTSSIRATIDRSRWPTTGELRTVGGILAASAVCLLTAVRITLNAPLEQSPQGLQLLYTIANTVAVLVPGIVAIVVGTVADTEWEILGLITAGTFSILAAIAPAASLPAVGVLLVAGVLVLIPPFDDYGQRAKSRLLFGGVLAAAIVLSLGANTEILASRARSIGTTSTVIALSVSPVALGCSRRAVLVGMSVAVLILAGAVSAPFVAGAMYLAVGAAVEPNAIIAAAGVGGGIAVVAEGIQRRQGVLVAGGLLLIAGGVPATIPRALAVILGAHLLLRAVDPRATLPANGGVSA